MNNNVENNTDQFLDPKDLAAAFEHTMNFVKGDTEALPDMMHHSGRLLLKLSRRLSTTQMVLLVGALTLGAIFVAKRVEEAVDETFDDDDNKQKALGGSGGNQGNRGGSASAQGSANGGAGKGSSSEGSGSQSSKSASSSGSGSSQKDSGKQSGNK